MDHTKIDSVELISQLREGGCGSIYLAKDADGIEPTFPNHEQYLVRVLNGMTVNRKITEGVYRRLECGKYPENVVPMVWRKPKIGASCLLMPLYGKLAQPENQLTPSSLQEVIDEYPHKHSPEKIWELIRKIALALNNLQKKKIAHGNLQPSNLFFDSDREVFVSDFAMGHMPGVSIRNYSNALLYAPPEQLNHPDGYLDGLAYNWDCYAFASIAYRLLTGKFPRCHSAFSQLEAEKLSSEHQDIDTQAKEIAQMLEGKSMESWPRAPRNAKEKKRQEIIERCLSLDPNERFDDLQDVINTWEKIDQDQQVKATGLKMKGALLLAALSAVGCLIYAGKLSSAQKDHLTEKAALNNQIGSLKENHQLAESSINQAVSAKQKAEQILAAGQQKASSREDQLRSQIVALAETNDDIIAWVMRTQNENLPELASPLPTQDVIAGQLREFLKTIEGQADFEPTKAHVLMHLAELEVLSKRPDEADKLLDSAMEARKSVAINDPDHASRMARARLVSLLQSLDEKNTDLTAKILPKARAAVEKLSIDNDTERLRINAVMQIVDGKLIEETEPETALAHYQKAITELKGVYDALPENMTIRSDLAQYTLHASDISKALNRVDDANRLKSEAAIHLQWLLEKNPDLPIAKVNLAEIEILAAEEDLRSGENASAISRLTNAEALLKNLPNEETKVDGRSYQIAVARGLSSIILRDRGRVTDAANNLDQAIAALQKIIAVNPDATEPLYRVSTFYWQRAGLAGTKGDKKTELKLGEKAVDYMNQVLTLGAGGRETALRRSLAYLYGDLGNNASNLGQSSNAKKHYQSAAAMWQSLIDKNGNIEEYLEGLKWSKSKY